MADWKQITARIRRARTGKDPVGQLSSLFEKTRDAMVAFELARVLETSGKNSDAAKWYVAAAERFRRADWKTKAQEAAVRLGADLSAASAEASAEALGDAPDSEPEASTADSSQDATEPPSAAAEASESGEAEDSSTETTAPSAQTNDRGRRRRGRRGGRNRGRGAGARIPAAPSASAEGSSTSAVERRGSSARAETQEAGETESPTPVRRGVSHVSVDSAADSSGPSLRGRSGDPGLSSRLSALEMQLRRLLNCPAVKLGEADHAPAGPGVLVLGDSDLTSYYYVEPCQTIRVAVGNLLRGGASRRGGDSIKPRLAEHLGIPEARVSKYLADHCVVRWLQLDEGASHFAHFVIATLRPALNE
jgi:hypothetical protein